ncbi:hypothetical protein [Duganella lactea]|uniref:hypothetical protein n=1 Tax=Duganella lactea TaxID=2692173 RepID=UPI0019290DBF|nr:hypothetical protein [Duganella lactea]
MSLYNFLMTWPRERLVKELQGQARDNAALQRRVLELEVEVFWMKVADGVRQQPASGLLGCGIIGSGARVGAAPIGSGFAITPTAACAAAFGLTAVRQRTPAELACWCETCRPITLDDCRMVLCPTCRNKRCPRAADHRNACSGSNEPGQHGSSYPVQPVTKGGA